MLSGIFIIKSILLRRVLLLLLTFLFVFTTFAQNTSGLVRGILIDSTSHEPINYATITVIGGKDSSFKSFTLSAANGSFEVNNLVRGAYILVASYQGLETIKKPFVISAEKTKVDFGTLKMQKAYNVLDEVVVKAEVPIKVTGDTVAYKADRFKTRLNATVEDLLKKLPGVQVDRGGSVKAHGEQVQKVYVDGKEFFGDDPTLATKNLTAEMVDEVQVFNDMSEEAKFSGFDDGSRTKAINLKLKKNRKTGLTGKAYGGYGTAERYDAGVRANYFNGASQTSIIAKTNNINNMGYSSGEGAGGELGDGGLTSTSSAGINYRDAWNESFVINGSYFFNHANTANSTKSFRQRFSADSTIATDRQKVSNNTNNNHRFNLRMVYTLDSLNSIIYTPKLNVQNSRTINSDTSGDYVNKNGFRYKLNDNRITNNNDGEGRSFTNALIWRKKFHKQGRTLSVNLSSTINNNTRNGYSGINSNFYNNVGLLYRQRKADYKISTSNQTNNYGANLTYTEPLANNKVVEFNYRYSNNRNNSDRKTYNYNEVTKTYDELVDTLTNEFRNKNTLTRIGTNFRHVKKKYNYQLGVAVQQTLLESNDLSKETKLAQRFINLFPSASFNYQFSRSRSLRISYQGNTNQPNIIQLQNLTDVTNYPYIRKGNPGLSPEFVNNISLTYNYFNMAKFNNIFAYITYRNTYNKIAYSIEQRAGGEQVTMPVNLNGVYNVSGNFNVGWPVKMPKGGNFNMNTSINYTRDANLINNTKNFTGNFSFGEELRLSYNYKDNLDLGINAGINYNSVSYTLQKEQNNSYYTHNYSADITYTFLEDFSLSTDIDYTGYSGRTGDFNQKFTRWNASIAKQLFKNKRGEIRLSVMDILNQNTNTSRNVADNYIEDVENTALKRFGLLTFSWNLNSVGSGRNIPAPEMFKGTGDIKNLH